MNVGFIGWRGMVGSVLMQRMIQEKDFTGLSPLFFSTSQIGGEPPLLPGVLTLPPLKDAFDLNELSGCDVIVSCQGGGYTEDIYPKLKKSGWKGYWIDAASTLRMEEDAVLILDPVNSSLIKDSLAKGVKTYVGANCTVSLMMMGLAGLFQNDLVEWISSMTYQAASGAGAKNMKELIAQMGHIYNKAGALADNPSASILETDACVTEAMRSIDNPTSEFGYPLAGSLLPWIDKEMGNGQSKEEWKGDVETNKILGNKPKVSVDGLCVRISSMRCHSQGLTIQLRKSIDERDLYAIIAEAHEWVHVIPNDRESSLKFLTPAAVSGSLDIPIGRLRPMKTGKNIYSAFTVGDQLLWGAAEPLRRMVVILKEYGKTL